MLEKEVFRACGLDDVYPALHPQLIDVAGVARQLAASGAAYDGNRYLDHLAEDDVDPGILSRSIILTAPSDFELKIGLALMRQRMQRSLRAHCQAQWIQFHSLVLVASSRSPGCLAKVFFRRASASSRRPDECKATA